MFIALELPKEVRGALSIWGDSELTDPALRPVVEDNLHITLAFLGSVAETEIPRLGELIGASAGFEAPEIVLGEMAARPGRGRPGLFALPVESAGAVELQGELQERLVEASLFRPERRPYWPHVTVARVRRERGGSRRPARVERVPSGPPEELMKPFRSVRIVLYRSQLQPLGALYTPLAQVELSRDGRQ